MNSTGANLQALQMPDQEARGTLVPAEAGFTFREFQASPQPVTSTPVPTNSYPAPYPGQPLPPRVYAPGGPLYGPIPTPTPPARKRRGRSVGCIVLYAFIAIALFFAGLGVALYEVGSHVLGGISANSSATQSAAMHLYQSVIAQPPTVQDPLTGATSTRWEVYDQGTYGCRFANDGLHAHISEKGYLNACTETADMFTNVAFQVQMQILAGDSGGLVFRAFNDKYYLFELSPGGAYHLYCKQGVNASQYTHLASGITQAIDRQANATNTLMVIAKGATFDLYVNQKFVVQVQDSHLIIGAVGVVAYDQTSPADVLYTNASLWDLDSINI